MHLPLQPYWALFKTYLALQRGRVILLAIVLLSMIDMQACQPASVALLHRHSRERCGNPESAHRCGAVPRSGAADPGPDGAGNLSERGSSSVRAFRSDTLRLNAFPLPRFLATSWASSAIFSVSSARWRHSIARVRCRSSACTRYYPPRTRQPWLPQHHWRSNR